MKNGRCNNCKYWEVVDSETQYCGHPKTSEHFACDDSEPFKIKMRAFYDDTLEVPKPLIVNEQSSRRYDLHKMTNLLKRAQDSYGYQNQVTVAIEELLELGKVLCKYPRYPDHTTATENLKEEIIDEIADVCVILQHLYMIFDIGNSDVEQAMDKKLTRLERWLDNSDHPYQTTIDREV